MFIETPAVTLSIEAGSDVSKTPVWLAEGNPYANWPWEQRPNEPASPAQMPDQVEVVVIGAGWTGSAMAYHWSKKAPSDQTMVVLEMQDPASGASGRNSGVSNMGRHLQMVKASVEAYLGRVRMNLSARERDDLALRFALVYLKASYHNAELVAAAVRNDGLDCNYVRDGKYEHILPDHEESLRHAVELGEQTGYDDWEFVSGEFVRQKTGAHTSGRCLTSKGSASFHPAKWVWSLFTVALRQNHVRLFTRTKVERVVDAGEHYVVHTNRGAIRARFVVNATEAYTPLLHPQFHDVILPTQTQAAFVSDAPVDMKPNAIFGSGQAFLRQVGSGALIGTDATRIPDHRVLNQQPSRFVTLHCLVELGRFFSLRPSRVTHEWAGPVGFTADEYPIVGLIDGKKQYIIGGMCGSGSAVAFNAGRCVCNRILGLENEADDYPDAFFAPSRVLSPAQHPWPDLDSSRSSELSGQRREKTIEVSQGSP